MSLLLLRRPRCALGLAAVLVLAGIPRPPHSLRAEPLSRAETPPNERAAWKELSLLRYAEAYRAFSAADTRSDRLGRALALLHLQPRTDARLSEARELLSALRTENPADEEGLAATYQLARLLQLHATPRDLPGAIALFEDLVSRAPSHPLAQQAVVKLAILGLFAEPDAARRRANVERLAPHFDSLTLPSAIRDLRLAFGNYYLIQENDPARALPHLLAAEATGAVVRGRTKADLLIQIGESAREAGQDEIARKHFQRFAEEFPRDGRGRAGLARQRLAELDNAAGSSAAQ